MSISGIIFFVSNNYILLIVSALIGTINVTGSETGSFLSLEQLILPQTLKEQNKKIHFLQFIIWSEHLQCLQEFYYPAYPTS